MRSASLAWLLDLAGMDTFVLKGGYKAYRHFIRQEMGAPAPMIVLAGKTGSGKTDILQAIAQRGHQVIDLEKIANHKGSVFGSLGKTPQPTNEQFENDLYHLWQKLDLTRPVWIEDESLSIGTITIPEPIYNRLITSQVIEIDLDFSQRVLRLVKEYSAFSDEDLVSCIKRITKKLGGDNTRKATDSVREGNDHLTAEILLTYYDKAYEKSLQKRMGHVRHTCLHLQQDDPERNAHLILTKYSTED